MIYLSFDGRFGCFEFWASVIGIWYLALGISMILFINIGFPITGFLKTKIALRIVIANILDHGPQQRQVIGQFTALDVLAQQIA